MADNEKSQEKTLLEQLKEKYQENLYRVPVEIDDAIEDKITKHEFYFKEPKPKHIDRLMQEVSNKPSRAMRNYVFSLVVDESREKLEQAVEKYPMLPMQITDKLNSLAGGGAFADIKKL